MGNFLHRDPVKYHGGGGAFTRNSERKGALEMGYLPLGEPVTGTWREGSFAKGPEGYESKALGMGISLHGGSVGQPRVSSSTRDFQIWFTGLWRWNASLCGSSVKGGLPC